MRLIFATRNVNKLKEIRSVLDPGIELVIPSDLGFFDDIPETTDTLKANAIEKARFIHNHFKSNTLADDTGLEVQALNGAPGVLSARYAGPSRNSDDNIQKLLSELKSFSNRKAQFRTVIALVLNGQISVFEGLVKGTIIHTKRGAGGFGYDPVFKPDGSQKTFAEMTLAGKNKISHRAVAIRKLGDFLNNCSEA